MDKIKALLEKAGVSNELAEQITKTLVEYKDTVRKTVQEEFNSKLEQAKKLFVEETELYKKDLANRLQIFCETKSAVIEGQLQKQAALSEKQAVKKLRSVYLALEGIQVKDEASNTAKALSKARTQIKQLAEERDTAIAKANRQTAVAEQLAKRARTILAENQQLKQKVVVENKRVKPVSKPTKSVTTKPISESIRRKPVNSDIENIANQID